MAKYLKSEDKRDGKIHIKRNDELYLDGVKLTEENISDVPLDVAIAYFANRVGSNFGSLENKLGKSISERLRNIANNPANNPDLLPFFNLSNSSAVNDVLELLNPTIENEDGSIGRKYSGGQGVESAEDFSNPEKVRYSLNLLALNTAIQKSKANDVQIEYARQESEDAKLQLQEAQNRIKQLEVELENSKQTIAITKRSKKDLEANQALIQAEIDRLNGVIEENNRRFIKDQNTIAGLFQERIANKVLIGGYELAVKDKDEEITKLKAGVKNVSADNDKDVKTEKSRAELHKTVARRATKTAKRAMIAAAIFLGTTILSIGGNIKQHFDIKNLQNQNAYYQAENKKLDNFRDLAESYGYKEGMVDGNGNPITVEQFIGIMLNSGNLSASEIEKITEVAKNYGYKEGMVDGNGNLISAKDYINSVLNSQKQTIDDLTQFAKSYGYKEGMVDENGNPISVKDYLQTIINDDTSDLKQEIEDLHTTIKGLGYNVDKNKTLSEIMNDIYQAFQDDKSGAISKEVLDSYINFATLLNNLGITSADLYDENGEFAKDNFNLAVGKAVELAYKNAEQVQKIEAKLESMFVALGIDGKVSDYETLSDAMDKVFAEYKDRNEDYQKMIDESLKTAFGVAGIKKQDGTLYSREDFVSQDAAIQFLASNCKGQTSSVDISEYINQISELKDSNKKLGEQVASLTTEMDKAKSDLADQTALYSALQGDYNALNGLYNTVKGEKETLEANVRNLNARIGELESQIAVKDSQIESLKSSLGNYEQRIAQLEEERDSLKAQLESANATIEAKNAQIQEKEKKIDELNEIIDTLTNNKSEGTPGPSSGTGNEPVGDEKGDGTPIEDPNPEVPGEQDPGAGPGSGSGAGSGSGSDNKRDEDDLGLG